MNSPIILSRSTWLAFVGLLSLAVSSVGLAEQAPKAWMDDASGYAIGGFDPVAYFVRAKAVRPQSGVETFWGGVSWKFRNVGNRAAFLAHPRTYVPRFGGVDPYLLAKHRQTVRGNPNQFDVFEGRLYLFHNNASFSQWRKHRKAFVIQAKQFWPKAARQIGLDPAEPVNPSDKVLLDDKSMCEPARWLQRTSRSAK